MYALFYHLLLLGMMVAISCKGDLYPVSEQVAMSPKPQDSAADSPSDMGKSSDTGVPEDTGKPADTGEPADTGKPTDTTGAPTDTGVPTDTQEPPDTGEKDTSTHPLPTDTATNEQESSNDTGLPKPDSDTVLPDSDTLVDTDSHFFGCFEEKVCSRNDVVIEKDNPCMDGFVSCEILQCEDYYNATCTPKRSRDCYDKNGEFLFMSILIPFPVYGDTCNSPDMFCCMHDQAIREDRECPPYGQCASPDMCLEMGLTPFVVSNCPDEQACCLML